MLKLIERDGWQLARTRGSHRQYRHPTKPGAVTVPGKPSDDLHPKTPSSILKQAGLQVRLMRAGPGRGTRMSRYLIIIEGDGSTNYSAYCPDLPGVAATGDSIDDCAAEMRDAIEFHIEGLHEAGEAVPPPTTRGRTVEVAA